MLSPTKFTPKFNITNLVSPALKAFKTTSSSLSSATNTSVFPVSYSWIKTSRRCFRVNANEDRDYVFTYPNLKNATE